MNSKDVQKKHRDAANAKIIADLKRRPSENNQPTTTIKIKSNKPADVINVDFRKRPEIKESIEKLTGAIAQQNYLEFAAKLDAKYKSGFTYSDLSTDELKQLLQVYTHYRALYLNLDKPNYFENELVHMLYKRSQV